MVATSLMTMMPSVLVALTLNKKIKLGSAPRAFAGTFGKWRCPVCKTFAELVSMGFLCFRILAYWLVSFALTHSQPQTLPIGARFEPWPSNQVLAYTLAIWVESLAVMLAWRGCLELSRRELLNVNIRLEC